jgi:hypothetical protein
MVRTIPSPSFAKILSKDRTIADRLRDFKNKRREGSNRLPGRFGWFGIRSYLLYAGRLEFARAGGEGETPFGRFRGRLPRQPAGRQRYAAATSELQSPRTWLGRWPHAMASTGENCRVTKNWSGAAFSLDRAGRACTLEEYLFIHMNKYS